MLRTNKLPVQLMGSCLALMRALSTHERDLIQLIVEIIQELRDLAYDVCQIFETVERWPSSPNGAVVILQSALVIATLYLPQDEKHQMWMKRKFAAIESMG